MASDGERALQRVLGRIIALMHGNHWTISPPPPRHGYYATWQVLGTTVVYTPRRDRHRRGGRKYWTGLCRSGHSLSRTMPP